MKQKRKQLGQSKGFSINGSKKAFDKRAKDSKEKRKDRASRQAKRKLSIEKIVKMMFEYFRGNTQT
ncbi:hypothetical protein AGMMS49921_13580 [Endomicrobiia bacterium]|nr:hypothetical protein AGMMS49921_13580 [Endomicrobiia bacterium]